MNLLPVNNQTNFINYRGVNTTARIPSIVTRSTKTCAKLPPLNSITADIINKTKLKCANLKNFLDNNVKINISDNRIAIFKLTYDQNLNTNIISAFKMVTSKLIGKKNYYKFNMSPITGEYEIFNSSNHKDYYKVGLAELDINGGKHVEKHLVSPDGTITDFVYADDVKGNRYLYYKITDKAGKTLYESDKKFKVIDENHFVSTTDGKSYDIQFNVNECQHYPSFIWEDKDTFVGNVYVSKLDNNGNKEKICDYRMKEYSPNEICKMVECNKHRTPYLSLLNLYENKGVGADYMTIDLLMLGLMKKLSGHEWERMYRSGILNVRRAYYDNARFLGPLIELGSNYDDIDSLEHEIGHGVSEFLQRDKEFMEIFYEEKRLYRKKAPKGELEQVRYLLNDWEALAETNSIVNTINSVIDTSIRRILFMKNFPRTIAYAANKTNARYE